MKKKSKLLFTDSDWSFPLIEKTWKVIEHISKDKYGLDFYEPQLEIVDFESMIIRQDVNVGLPINYAHWSFGKAYFIGREEYQQGLSGLAYELIINTDPAIAYLMENNTMTMQALVLAHASVGHSSFFKNNYLFKQGINPKLIIPFMEYAADFIEKCENKYGSWEIEELLDIAHSLAPNSVDTIPRGRYKTTEDKLIAHNFLIEEAYDELYREDLLNCKRRVISEDLKYGDRPIKEENLLYFIEKISPTLEVWEREILRIVRIQAQYFYPQRLTKLMNEGWASFWHYTLMNDLYDYGYINEGQLLEVLDNHCSVCQHPANQISLQLNPYKLGFSLFKDIRRRYEKPTKEDLQFFPEIAEYSDWIPAMQNVMKNYNDSTFLLQYLSPKVVRDLGLISILNIPDAPEEVNFMHILEVKAIQCDEDFNKLRQHISEAYTKDAVQPKVWIEGDKTEYKVKYERKREMNEGIINTIESYIEALM